jgi:transcriptional regulator with XRE-family HTH domain
MKASEWIDRVKIARGWDTDYRVAKELGLSKQTVGSYRGKVATMDEDTAEKIAAALKLNPAGIVLDQTAERTKNPITRAALSRMAEELCILCKVIAATVLIAPCARSTGP